MAYKLLKAHKNTISRIIKGLEKESRDRSYAITRSFQQYVKTSYGVISIRFQYELPEKFKAVEENGILYIGIDLSVKGTLTYNPEDYGNSILENIMDEVAPYFGDHPNQKMIDAIGLTPDESDRRAISRDPSIQRKIMNSDVYIETKNAINNVLSDYTMDVHLHKGEFPKSSDRQLLPAIVFNSETGMADYCKERSASSYRSGRDKVSFNDILSKLSRIYSCIPRNLIAMELSSSYIKP
jgi:hypothetical protein